MDSRLNLKASVALWLSFLVFAAINPISIRTALADSGASVNIGASINIDAGIDVHEHVHAIAPPAAVVEHVTVVHPASELFCTGNLQYQVGSGKWCTHVRGKAHIDLPLRVRVSKTSCRLSLPDLGTFDVAAHSCFSINRLADRRYALLVESGAVRYSVIEDVSLRVASPFEGIGAWCVGGVRVATPGRHCRGRVVVDADEGFQIYNLDGRVAYERGGRTIREVIHGSGLHVRLAAGIDMRAAAALSLERALLIDDYSSDLGWDEVEVYRKGHGRGKGEAKNLLKRVSVFGATDTHAHQVGKGHQEHGNGKGKGHSKIKENKGKGRGGK